MRAKIVVLACLGALATSGTASAEEPPARPFEQAVPVGQDPGRVQVPGTDAALIERIKEAFPAPEGSRAPDGSVTDENSAPVDGPATLPSWAPAGVDPDALAAAVPTARAMGPLPDVENLLRSPRHTCCFGAPAPLYLGEVTAQNANSFGRCLFELASDTPGAKYGNTRDITFGMTIDCPHGWLQGTGQARLMDARNPNDAFCCHLEWAPQFWYDGNMGYGYGPYHRTSDTQTEFIAGWFDMTVDDPSASAGFSSAAGTNHGLTCEGLLSKRLRCWFYTQPFAYVPDVLDPVACNQGPCGTVKQTAAQVQALVQQAVALADESLIDEDGDPVTAPLVPHWATQLGVPLPLEDPSTPIVSYASPNGGPLAAEGITEYQGGTPVSTGSCDLGAGILRGYHAERAAQGERPHFYSGSSRALCGGSVDSAYCYVELWRRRDFAMLEQDNARDNIEDGSCSVTVYHGYYRRPTKHYAKAAIQLDAGPDGFWGSGRGPEGWSCSGQKTRHLTCRRNTPAKS